MEDEKRYQAPDGIIAVGAYLRFLRKAAGLTMAEIADIVGIDPSKIWRIENGKTDTKGTILFKFISGVRGRAEDVELLMNNPSAQLEDGEALARLRSMKKQ